MLKVRQPSNGTYGIISSFAVITREISTARSHRATRHTDKTSGEKMPAAAVHEFDAYSPKMSVPEPMKET
jgi:hypothetical protein